VSNLYNNFYARKAKEAKARKIELINEIAVLPDCEEKKAKERELKRTKLDIENYLGAIS